MPHSYLSAGLIFFGFFTFILATAFNSLAGSGAGVPQGDNHPNTPNPHNLQIPQILVTLLILLTYRLSVFYATVGDISDKFELYITPAGDNQTILIRIFLFPSSPPGSTFSIWSIIYLWLAVSLVMFIVTIFQTNSRGRFAFLRCFPKKMQL